MQDDAHHEADEDGVNEEVHLVHLVPPLVQVCDPRLAALALAHETLDVDRNVLPGGGPSAAGVGVAVLTRQMVLPGHLPLDPLVALGRGYQPRVAGRRGGGSQISWGSLPRSWTCLKLAQYARIY